MRVRTTRSYRLLILALLAGLTGGAQADLSASPEGGARAYLDAMAVRDWTGAAAIYHPESAERLKQMLWPLIAGEMNCGHAGFFHRVLGPDADYAAIAVADPAPFVAALFAQMMGQAAAAGLTIDSGEVVGTLAEGDTQRHVLVRARVGTAAFAVTRMLVLSFTRAGDGWGLQVGSELESYAYRVRQSFDPQCERR